MTPAARVPSAKRPAGIRRGAASSRGGPVAAGTITGTVTCDQLTAIGAGQRLLARVAGVLAAVALLVLVFVGGLALTTSVLVPLIPSLLVLTGLLLGYRVLLFGFRPRRRSGRRVGRLLAKATGGLAGIVATPIRAGAGMRREHSTEVRRFRITEVSGRLVDCELTGELAGAPPRPGDVVEVFGRQTRHGTVQAREVVSTADQARTIARPNLGFVLARGADLVALGLGSACVAGVAYVLLTR